MKPRRTTLADIARRAGVHVTTVSLAMRQHPKIPPETRGRICRLAEEMGYRPDPILQALTAYRTRTTPRKHPPTLAYFSDQPKEGAASGATTVPMRFDGARTRAYNLGFNLEHVCTTKPVASNLRLIKTFFARQIGGVLVADVASPDLESRLDWTRFSAVKIGHAPAWPPLHRVMSDDYNNIRIAAAHAIAAGYRRIGLVMPQSWNDRSENRWVAGHMVAQANLAPADRIPPLLFPDAPRHSGENPVSGALFAKWFRATRPDVIISKASFVRAAFIETLLRVPRDVAFIDLFLEDTSGRTAGVRHNHEQVGDFAVEILAGLIERKVFGVPSSAATTVITGVWHDGFSCPPRNASAGKNVKLQSV